MSGVNRGGGRDVLPRQGFESAVQGLLVAQRREKVVATPLSDPLGGIDLGMHGVGGDHGPVQVEGLEQVRWGGDLWLDLFATRSRVRTVPVAWSRTGRR